MQDCDSTEANVYVRRKYLDEDWQKMVRHAFSHWDTQFLKGPETCKHNFINCLLMAFDQHLPLVLKPQHFWLLIVQAVSAHVEANPEELREKFVSFEGKMELELDVTASAAAGFLPQHWEKAVFNFNKMIASAVKPGVYEAVSCGSTFSNTTGAEHVAAGMSVMDLCKSYFDYKMMTRCGFPQITLLGTVQDWKNLCHKAERLVNNFCLPEFAAHWWPALKSVLIRFPGTYASAASGTLASEAAPAVTAAMKRFWEGAAKIDGVAGSGGSTWVSGWVNVFFPYVGLNKLSPFCVPYKMGIQYPRGLDTHQFTAGLSSVPVTLDDHPLEFRSGFVGVGVAEDGVSITPCVGWYVASGKTERTTKFYDVKVKEVEGAMAVLTNIGAVLPLLDFVRTPPAFSRIEKLKKEEVRKEKAKGVEVELTAIQQEIKRLDERKTELMRRMRDLYALAPELANRGSGGGGGSIGGLGYVRRGTTGDYENAGRGIRWGADGVPRQKLNMLRM